MEKFLVYLMETFTNLLKPPFRYRIFANANIMVPGRNRKHHALNVEARRHVHAGTPDGALMRCWPT